MVRYRHQDDKKDLENMLWKHKNSLKALVIVMLLSGCAVDEIYRSKFSPCEVNNSQSCETASIQLYHQNSDSEFTLGFVEIDDQGQLRSRKQLRTLLNTLYEMSAQESLLINVFVHGWHHNASPNDANVRSFGKSMKRLSQVESQLSKARNQKRRKVVGVYVGWRGESVTTPVINNLTFWDRKSTAQEVGLLGITELLLKLEEISNIKNTQDEQNKSRLVVVGHSFGGAAIYSATAQILASRFVDNQENKNFDSVAEGFGDLVVLLNPAFEALRYAPLYDMGQARCGYFPTQRPKLVILTSEADWATKLAFPIGRALSTVFETHADVQRSYCGRNLELDEGAADRNTVGHFEPLMSHTLQPIEKDSNYTEAKVENIGNIWASQKEGHETKIGRTLLTHLKRTEPRNPFLNIKVDKALIANHNDVFGDEILEFLRLLIVLSTG